METQTLEIKSSSINKVAFFFFFHFSAIRQNPVGSVGPYSRVLFTAATNDYILLLETRANNPFCLEPSLIQLDSERKSRVSQRCLYFQLLAALTTIQNTKVSAGLLGPLTYDNPLNITAPMVHLGTIGSQSLLFQQFTATTRRVNDQIFRYDSSLQPYCSRITSCEAQESLQLGNLCAIGGRWRPLVQPSSKLSRQKGTSVSCQRS